MLHFTTKRYGFWNYVRLLHLYDDTRACAYGFSRRQARRMRKYYRKILAAIVQALSWLGEWQQSQQQEGR